MVEALKQEKGVSLGASSEVDKKQEHQQNHRQSVDSQLAKMPPDDQTSARLADYFAVIGLDNELKPLQRDLVDVQKINEVEIVVMERQPLSDLKKAMYLQRQNQQTINGVLVNGQERDELLQKQAILEAQNLLPYPVPKHDPRKEAWIDLDGTKNFYLRLVYGDKNPITDINFFYITQKTENKLAIPAKDKLTLVPVRRFDGVGSEVKRSIVATKDALVFYGVYDLKFYLDRQLISDFTPKRGLSNPQTPNKALCMAIRRQKKSQPLYDVQVIQSSESGGSVKANFQAPEGAKLISYRLGMAKNRLLMYRKLQINLMETPFRPTILDRYPPVDRPDEPFQPQIASFCFPSGMKLHREHNSPKSWSFILTGSMGQRTYGTCLIFDEEPSLSLKRRLQNAHIEDFANVWTQKAICIISRFSFFESFKMVLNQFYRIQLSQNMHCPLERFILNVMDEVPLPQLGKNMVNLEIEESISFFRPCDQYQPYASRAAIQNTFKALTVDQVIELFFQLLLEQKILLISRHKTLLTQVAVTLQSFMFPLAWQHTMIPILCADMIEVIDAPFPFLIGVPQDIYDEAIESGQIELPPSVTLVDLDNCFVHAPETVTETTKMPGKEFKILKEKLMRATMSVDERPHLDLEMIDDAFFKILVDPEELEHQINEIEVRDAFLEFMQRVMHGYKKYIKDPGQGQSQKQRQFRTSETTNLSSSDVVMTTSMSSSVEEGDGANRLQQQQTFRDEDLCIDHANSRDFFDHEKFRADRSATSPVTFIYKLTMQTCFSTFIESRSIGKTDEDAQIIYFDEIAKETRTKKRAFLLEPFEASKVIKAEPPSEVGLEKDRKYLYKVFPSALDQSLYYTPRKLYQYKEDSQQSRSVHRQIVSNKQIKLMNEAEFARYMSESIYTMWFHCFAANLPLYKSQSAELIHFARTLLKYLCKKLHPMSEVEIVFRRMFEACGSCGQLQSVKDLYQDLQVLRYVDPDKITYGTYYQSLLLCNKGGKDRRNSTGSVGRNWGGGGLVTESGITNSSGQAAQMATCGMGQEQAQSQAQDSYRGNYVASAQDLEEIEKRREFEEVKDRQHQQQAAEMMIQEKEEQQRNNLQLKQTQQLSSSGQQRQQYQQSSSSSLVNHLQNNQGDSNALMDSIMTDNGVQNNINTDTDTETAVGNGTQLNSLETAATTIIEEGSGKIDGNIVDHPTCTQEADQEKREEIKLSQVLEGTLYIELCNQCPVCEQVLREEELFSLFTQDQQDYTIRCPAENCKGPFVPKFTVQSEHRSDFIDGKDGLTLHLLPPVALQKEFINTLQKKGDQILRNQEFIRDHSVVFWNLIVYFKIMKLPCFILDQDFSSRHTKVQISWIKKYLPTKVLENHHLLMRKSQNHSSGACLPQGKLDKDGLRRFDRQTTASSPARPGSITRVVSGIKEGLGNLIRRSSSRGPRSQISQNSAKKVPNNQIPSNQLNSSNSTQMNNTTNENQSQASASEYGQNKTGQNSSAARFGSAQKYSHSLLGASTDIKELKMPTLAKIKAAGSSVSGAGSVRSGSGPGSVGFSSASDLERIERLLKQSKFATKSVVRHFGKHFEEFRQQMSYTKEIINSDYLMPKSANKQFTIPASMNRHTTTSNIQQQTWSQKNQFDSRMGMGESTPTNSIPFNLQAGAKERIMSLETFTVEDPAGEIVCNTGPNRLSNVSSKSNTSGRAPPLGTPLQQTHHPHLKQTQSLYNPSTTTTSYSKYVDQNTAVQDLQHQPKNRRYVMHQNSESNVLASMEEEIEGKNDDFGDKNTKFASSERQLTRRINNSNVQQQKTTNLDNSSQAAAEVVIDQSQIEEEDKSNKDGSSQRVVHLSQLIQQQQQQQRPPKPG